jgi:hypothetical protein
MHRTRTLLLAAGCTAAGALGAGAIGSSAHDHGGRHHGFAHHRGFPALFGAVHAEAVVPTRAGDFTTVTYDRGTVLSVSGGDLEIREGTADSTYKTVLLNIPSDAKVRRGHDEAALSDLEAGDRVLVISTAKRTIVLAAPARKR